MMGILIENMEMPKHCGYCRFRYDGICHALQKTQYSMEECPLVSVPPHGRLIDADALCKVLQKKSEDEWNNKIAPFSWAYAYDCLKDIVEIMPTVILADDLD